MQYCEQLLARAGFEPWNAVSNAAFVLAAIVAVRTAPRTAWRADTAGLLVLAVAIGAGSFAWHATHASWAELADVLPILAFVLLFLFSAVRRLPGGTVLAASAACGAMLIAIAGLIATVPRALNGSVAYLPVWTGLAALAVFTPDPDLRRLLRGATALFAVSLAARTLDLAICADFPHGSHWLWHVCNGGVIYLALRAALRPPAPG